MRTEGSLFVLCLLCFCTGSGSSAGLASAMNATAKVTSPFRVSPSGEDRGADADGLGRGGQSFPDTTRATACGLVLAGYGLSALSVPSHLLSLPPACLSTRP